MIFPTTNSAAFSLALSISAFKTLPAIVATDSCTSIDYIKCIKTESPPTLDASDISDWNGVEVFESPLTAALTSKMYTAGNMKIQCVYDSTDIYFLYQILASTCLISPITKSVPRLQACSRSERRPPSSTWEAVLWAKP